jgi:hypothetical protein
MKKTAAGLVLSLVISLALAGSQLAPEVRVRALKLIADLEKLEHGHGRPSSGSAASYAVSESDLNAWIAYSMATEMEKYVRSCELRLHPGNRAEGKLVLDLSATPVSAILPARPELYFSARAETKEGRIRITMDDLFLGTQRLSPGFIDTVIAFAASLEGQKATSLGDWYPLPYGIRRLESQAGRLICYYK